MADSEKPTRDKRRSGRSKAQWRLAIGDWKQSDLSLSQYCEKHELHPRTFKSWLSKLGEGPGRGLRFKRPEAVAEANSTRLFAPVQVREQTVPAHAFSELTATVLLAGGRRVQLTGALRFEHLGRLLDAVEGGAAC